MDKKEQLKQMQMAMSAYANMKWAFQMAIAEKEHQIEELAKNLKVLQAEIDAEKKPESKKEAK